MVGCGIVAYLGERMGDKPSEYFETNRYNFVLFLGCQNKI
jgi:hypothetical protein